MRHILNIIMFIDSFDIYDSVFTNVKSTSSAFLQKTSDESSPKNGSSFDNRKKYY